MRTLAEILGEELHAKVDWVAMQANLELLMEGSLQLILERYVRLDRAFVWRTCALRMGRYNGD